MLPSVFDPPLAGTHTSSLHGSLCKPFQTGASSLDGLPTLQMTGKQHCMEIGIGASRTGRSRSTCNPTVSMPSSHGWRCCCINCLPRCSVDCFPLDGMPRLGHSSSSANNKGFHVTLCEVILTPIHSHLSLISGPPRQFLWCGRLADGSQDRLCGSLLHAR